MKKKIVFLIIINFLIIGISIVFKNNALDIKQDINDDLAIKVQTKDNDYVRNDYFPSGEGYTLNMTKSTCANQGDLIWDNDIKKVIMSNKTTDDKCELYFDFDYSKYVMDLSGNGNNGVLHNIVKWDEDGITTSDDTIKGYVNCGLANYDFKNSISLIMRVRWNDLMNSGYSRFLGNGTISFGMANTDTYNDLYMPHIHLISNNNNFYVHGTRISSDEWYTLIGIYDGSNSTFWVNDRPYFRKWDSALPTSNIPILLGAAPYSVGDGEFSTSESEYGYNTFSDLLIYDRAINDDEVKALLNDIDNPINKDQLLLWYKFANSELYYGND